jgi:RNA polymerase sigma factor (sigma-70 family)
MSDLRRRTEELYRAHGHAVLRRARRLLGDSDDAHDVMQDVFLDIYRNGDRFSGRSSVATYLYSMTTHACLNRLRNGRTRTRLVAIEVSGGTGMSPALAESRALAHQILAALSPEDAELAVYLYADELTHDEVAALLGCSRRHVGDLARRLQEKIADFEPERGVA